MRALRILITGAGGQLGQELVATLQRAARYEVVGAARDRLDIADRDQVLGAITSLRPDLVVHAAAWTAVDACQGDPDRAWQINALGSRHVAEGARLVGAHLVAVSTDYVFDGTLPRPYHEWDRPNPQSVYGQTKWAGEREVLSQLPGAAVVRTSWVCGAYGRNILKTILELAGRGQPLRFVDDQRGCPTLTEDLAGMVVRLLIERRPGLFHVTNQGATSWFGFARDVVTAAGLDRGLVTSISTEELDPPRPAPRPANSVLDNAALRLSGLPLLPDYHEPLTRAVGALTGRVHVRGAR